MNRFFYAVQYRFRSRLQRLRRERQTQAHALGMIQRQEEKKVFEDWLAWKIHLAKHTCDECGYYRHVPCERHILIEGELIRGLQLKVGINRRVEIKFTPPHNEDRMGGPPGFRSCGKASWDNAVRAWEEDR